MNKEQKQLINEWLEKFVNDKPRGILSEKWLKDFQKQHNLIYGFEVGKWYKYIYNETYLAFINKKDENGKFYGYGINVFGEWSTRFEFQKNYHQRFEQAPETYVIERLKWSSENVMMYNHEEPNYNCLFGGKELTNSINPVKYYLRDNKLFVHDGYCDNCIMADGKWAETFEEKEQPIKPAYKSKGGEHGKKVIQKLVELGGNNRFSRLGTSECYYFIDEDGDVWNKSALPQGYTECFLDDEKENQTITIQIPKGVDYKIERV